MGNFEEVWVSLRNFEAFSLFMTDCMQTGDTGFITTALLQYQYQYPIV